jgi:chemotaxis protein methyltransferase CheR
MTTPGADAADLAAFRQMIGERLGLALVDGRGQDLEELLLRRLAAHGCDTTAYLEQLRGPAGEAELGVLARDLTVNETYFFRNHDQFRALREVVLPGLAPPAILSAGCSTGDEAYSLAIILAEQGIRHVSIHAIDVNPRVIAAAQAGRYSPWALRQTSPEVVERWFVRDGRDHVLDPTIRRMVRFETRNLMDPDPAFWQPGRFGLVMCRNVIMYFTADKMRLVLQQIARALAPGGHLFLGHAETLRGMMDGFTLQHTHETFYYQRAGGPTLRAAASTPDIPALVAAVEDTTSWAAAIQAASERIAALTQPRAPAPPPSAPPRPILAPAIGGTQRLSGWGAEAEGRSQLFELLRQERYGEVSALLGAMTPEEQTDPDVLLLRAIVLTNAGAIAEAEAVCQSLLGVDATSAGAHYLMALCREHDGDDPGAISHDEAASHLDHSFAMPYLHLGLVRKRAGDLERAREALSQAEVMLRREEASRILMFGGGFTRETLVQLCRAELRACGGAG